jgi:non-canonical (house-cleaning) NTP pyrophosphatase
METMRIAVGSKRAPKLAAVREALEVLGPLLHPKASFEVRGFEASTGVSRTPRSRTELMAGARGRCEALMRIESQSTFVTARRHLAPPAAAHPVGSPQPGKAGVPHSGNPGGIRGTSRLGASYFVGLEGGLDVVYENGHENGRRLVFLESWAFVSDAGGKGFYGQSGAILLPEPLAVEVLDRGIELSQAIEAYTGMRGIRDSQGAWGVLTKNLINRQESFRIAVISAFAPFFNAELYQRL